MADEKESAKLATGCAFIIPSVPAAVIWYVLFGMMLHKTGAGVMEWSLYVGYLICSILAMTFGTIWRLIHDV